jgi:hypothetical protein
MTLHLSSSFFAYLTTLCRLHKLYMFELELKMSRFGNHEWAYFARRLDVIRNDLGCESLVRSPL